MHGGRGEKRGRSGGKAGGSCKGGLDSGSKTCFLGSRSFLFFFFNVGQTYIYIYIIYTDSEQMMFSAMWTKVWARKGTSSAPILMSGCKTQQTWNPEGSSKDLTTGPGELAGLLFASKAERQGEVERELIEWLDALGLRRFVHQVQASYLTSCSLFFTTHIRGTWVFPATNYGGIFVQEVRCDFLNDYFCPPLSTNQLNFAAPTSYLGFINAFRRQTVSRPRPLVDLYSIWEGEHIVRW